MTVKNIILFDMDGTLTEPRQLIQQEVIEALISITKSGHHVGIVTGSPWEYMTEQLQPLFDTDTPLTDDDEEMFHFLPCNGTRYFFTENGVVNETITDSMKTELGAQDFNKLMATLIKLQAEATGVLLGQDIELTGNFIENRDSLVNWCPIGRNSDSKNRAKFVEFDEKSGFRNNYIHILNSWFKYGDLQNRITVALGGSTSFDVYPTGWDKTFCLSWFDNYTTWFVGDKCRPGGNDYHIYEALKESGRSFESDSPENTVEIINNILQTLSPDSSAG